MDAALHCLFKSWGFPELTQSFLDNGVDVSNLLISQFEEIKPLLRGLNLGQKIRFKRNFEAWEKAVLIEISSEARSSSNTKLFRSLVQSPSTASHPNTRLELPVEKVTVCGSRRSTDSLSQSEMVWSEDSLAKLIEYVEKFNFLYDYSELQNCHREKVRSAWKKIGQKLGRTASETRNTWMQLYKTYNWLTKSEEGKANEECTWPFLERMSYLKPYLVDAVCTAKETMGEDLIDYEASLEAGIPVPAFIKHVRPEIESSEQDNMEGLSQVEDCEYSQSPVPHTPFHPPLNGMALQKSLEIEEALCQYLKKKVSKEKDPNELFLTSVAHDMKMLPMKEQAVFKMKVQQLLVEMISKSSGSAAE